MGIDLPDSRRTSPPSVLLTLASEGESFCNLHVCLSFHTSTGSFPRCHAANYGIQRISSWLFTPGDHKLWTASLLHESIEKHMPRPIPHALFRTGILRTHWDHQAAADVTQLHVHLLDQSLVRSIISPPATPSSEALKWLRELFQQLNTDIFTSYSHQTVDRYPVTCMISTSHFDELRVLGSNSIKSLDDFSSTSLSLRHAFHLILCAHTFGGTICIHSDFPFIAILRAPHCYTSK